jgi:putative ABC transport system substrate-binding protein
LGKQMRRRQFVGLLGGAIAWPVSARAKRPAQIPRIGIIDDAPMWQSFRQALREFGYVEGQSVVSETDCAHLRLCIPGGLTALP